MKGPHECFAIGAFQGECLIGYIFAGVFRGALSGFIWKNRGYLLSRLLIRPWLIFNPLFFDRILLASRMLIRFRGTTRFKEKTEKTTERFGILAIAVDPNHHHKGIGRELMQHVEKIACEHGIARVYLSVNPTNSLALQFYEKQGWHRSQDRDAWNGAMWKNIEKQSTGCCSGGNSRMNV
jgi:ribosomal protein S18 acetylase RimI-like enzyme